MKLDKGVIRPGIVLEILDNGQIKASAPGLFSFEEDTSLLPPIYPLFMGSNANAFSKLNKYDDVWIMNFSDNPQQLYWFRKDTLSNNENIPLSEENVEIICNRDIGGDWATIYFSDGSGWVIRNGDSTIQIRTDGSIMLNTGMPNRCIDINGKNISIGSEGTSAHPAAYGDGVVDAISAICKLLNDVAIKAMSTPYTMVIGTEILKKISSVTETISGIPSNHVKID